MCEPRPEPVQTDDLMTDVQNCLETVRALLEHDEAQTQEGKIQLQQLANLEEVLLDQEAQLDAVNKVLEEFNYSVAHELFAPLRRISGFTREIKQRCADKLDKEGMQDLDTILDSSQKMNELIEALIQVSRLLHVDLQTASVDLGEAARTLGEVIAVKYAPRSVELDVGAQLLVKGDPSLLKIAVGELLDNAWKYTAPVDKPRVELGAYQAEAEAVFYVRDNGVGFDMADYGRLFHPFQRLHDRALFAGNGLGLTAVKRIVERHGGQVWAEAAPGRGATFYFTIPTPTLRRS